MVEERYRRQVQLLVQLLPIVAADDGFALKGGTAINLFDADMPRLSVDIDLTYLGLEVRNEALGNCRARMERLAKMIERQTPGTYVERQCGNTDQLRLIARMDRSFVKIESSPVARGVVGSVEFRDIDPAVEEQFGYARIQCISRAELYGGKICAALDRQHPRDLFDVRRLMDGRGLTRDVFDGFLVSLLSSSRPLAEILSPNRKDLAAEFVDDFQGMTDVPVTLASLDQSREELIDRIGDLMTVSDSEFLLDFKRGEPDWDHFAYPHACELPAIRWKQLNLDRMPPDRRRAAINKLEAVLTGMI